MNAPLKTLITQESLRRPFMDQLAILYKDMDQAYRIAAEHYGFYCKGCEENCCATRFFHHTHVEYLYLLEGFLRLDERKRIEVSEIADGVCRQTALLEEKNEPIRLMCPLNSEGLCLVYDFRPMICRLHGISHELRKPGHNPMLGPGCEAFTMQAQGKAYYPFDRTPFYRRMAILEENVKQAFGIQGKFKKTIAMMIVEFCKTLPAIAEGMLNQKTSATPSSGKQGGGPS